LRAKLATVGKEGGNQPLCAAALLALLREVRETGRDVDNGVVLAYVDSDTVTVTAQGDPGATWRRALIETATRMGNALVQR
jgi:hypothetical protein